MWSLLILFALIHFTQESIFGVLPHPEELNLKKRQTCFEPHYCNKRGLCIGGDSNWTVHCECDTPYWGRQCQYVYECQSPSDTKCFFKNIIGNHFTEGNEIWSKLNSEPGEIITVESEEIGLVHSYRFTLAYTMAVHESNHDNPQLVFNSPNEYDSIEIKTRTCGNAVHFPHCFSNQTASDCAGVQETNRPCSWTSQTVYAYYTTEHSNKEKTLCVDVKPTETEHFVQIGIRAKCNNKNGCNVKSHPGSESWKIGSTIFHFRMKVEPGTCHGQELPIH
ncbi:uncharacterized protein LOC133181257 [Saccostrea echinata]|uniref:uncharacterized protein LOC133181257 n=1 Tax=Saccostrea echinata TaxID=191078 RepID=UPI002A821540|nr:uncharacterized protein LOC133181257 [Saccostrea echinata]